jgi:hypothetical protein
MVIEFLKIFCVFFGTVIIKGRFLGFIRHCGFVKPIVPSPLGLPSFTTRGAMYQSETQRTLLAEEGTNGIWPEISQF